MKVEWCRETGRKLFRIDVGRMRCETAERLVKQTIEKIKNND